VTGRALRRRLASGVMTGLVVVLCFLAVLPLLFILGDLVAKGASSIDWAFFTRNPVPRAMSAAGSRTPSSAPASSSGWRR